MAEQGKPMTLNCQNYPKQRIKTKKGVVDKTSMAAFTLDIADALQPCTVKSTALILNNNSKQYQTNAFCKYNKNLFRVNLRYPLFKCNSLFKPDAY